MKLIDKVMSKLFSGRKAPEPGQPGQPRQPGKGNKNSIEVTLLQFSEEIQQYYAPIKERLTPLINYYNGLNKREKIIARVGGVFVLGYACVYLVVTPYMEWRNAVVATHDTAYEEFVWLESQKGRVKEIILARGGDFNAALNVDEVVAKYAPSGNVEQLPGGEYIITVAGDKGAGFFNSVNTIVNRGGELVSVELSRSASSAEASFVARVKL